MFEIEKGIPIPIHHRPGRTRKYPFGEMDIGDSFYVEAPQRRISEAASKYGKKHCEKFATRTENGGCRCWRIA